MEVKATSVFSRWLKRLKDVQGRARIQTRIDRLAAGNPGNHKMLKGEVYELKIDVGPGYRVYYTRRGNIVIILLCGGDKSTQVADIATAQRMAQNI